MYLLKSKYSLYVWSYLHLNCQQENVVRVMYFQLVLLFFIILKKSLVLLIGNYSVSVY